MTQKRDSRGKNRATTQTRTGVVRKIEPCQVVEQKFLGYCRYFFIKGTDPTFVST
jgi:hypothetical protein